MKFDAPLLAILGEGFFARLSFSVVGFALPLYARQLGMSLAEVGMLISANVAVAMLLKPVLGRTADRVGWKRSAVAGVGLRSLVPLLLAAAALPWQLFAVRALHGVSEAAREPSVDTLLAAHGEKANAVASAFAWYATARSVGASLGHAVSGVLLTVTAYNFPLVFAVAFALALLPLALVLRYVPQDGHGEEREAPPAAPPVPAAEAAAAPRPGTLAVAGLGLLMNATAQMLHGLLPVLATEYAGLTPAETGLVYALSTLVVLFSGPLFGWLSDHVSRDLVLGVRGAANIVSSAIYLVAPSFAGVALGRCVDDLGKAAFRPAWGAMMAMASMAGGRRRAATMGAVSLGQDAGEIIGPILAGFLWNTWGIAAMLAIRIALAAATECYALIVGRRLHASYEPRHKIPATDMTKETQRCETG